MFLNVKIKTQKIYEKMAEKITYFKSVLYFLNKTYNKKNKIHLPLTIFIFFKFYKMQTIQKENRGKDYLFYISRLLSRDLKMLFFIQWQ